MSVTIVRLTVCPAVVWTAVTLMRMRPTLSASAWSAGTNDGQGFGVGVPLHGGNPGRGKYVRVKPVMSTATMACGPVPSSRVMHAPVTTEGHGSAREYSTSSDPASAARAFPRPAIRPLSFRSERTRIVVAVRSAIGRAMTHPQPLVGLVTPAGQVTPLPAL